RGPLRNAPSIRHDAQAGGPRPVCSPGGGSAPAAPKNPHKNGNGLAVRRSTRPVPPIEYVPGMAKHRGTIDRWGQVAKG
ncbi:hypothetical protein ACFL5O_01145, partial [Myxococcota bacterium]